MTHPALLRLIRRFLRLETLAHKLYLVHTPHVPASAKQTFRAFIRTEERHRRLFERLYCEFAHVQRPPTFPVSTFLITCIAHLIRFGGFRAICRFECAVEQKAVADYEQALQLVKHTRVRKTIQTILRDETSHASLAELLRGFQKEEQEHIHHMHIALQKKISTVTR